MQEWGEAGCVGGGAGVGADAEETTSETWASGILQPTEGA